MCNPVLIMAAGAAISAYSQYESGQSQQKAANYNARVEKRAADDAINRGAIDASEVRERGRRIAAAQHAQFGAAGIEGSSGSALDILTGTEGMTELDAARTVNNARRTAWGLNTQADIDVFQGRAAARTGTMNAAGTILTSAGQGYYAGQSAGYWGNGGGGMTSTQSSYVNSVGRR